MSITTLNPDIAEAKRLLSQSWDLISEYRKKSWQDKHGLSLTQYIVSGLEDQKIIPPQNTLPGLVTPDLPKEFLRSLERIERGWRY